MSDSDNIKLQHNTLIEEYKNLRAEIEIRLNLIDKVVNYEILLILGVVAASIQLFVVRTDFNKTALEYILLVLPIPFCALGCTYSIHNLFILKIAKYIHQFIRPQVNDLLKPEKELLDYETFARKEMWGNKDWSAKIVKKILTFLWAVVIPCICLVSFLILTWDNLDTSKNFNYLQITLFILNIICIYFATKICLKYQAESKIFNK